MPRSDSVRALHSFVGCNIHNNVRSWFMSCILRQRITIKVSWSLTRSVLFFLSCCFLFPPAGNPSPKVNRSRWALPTVSSFSTRKDHLLAAGKYSQTHGHVQKKKLNRLNNCSEVLQSKYKRPWHFFFKWICERRGLMWLKQRRAVQSTG